MRKIWGRVLLFAVVPLGAALLVLWAKPLLAEPLELSRYTASNHSRMSEYHQ